MLVSTAYVIQYDVKVGKLVVAYTLFFYKQRFFSTQPQFYLTFS